MLVEYANISSVYDVKIKRYSNGKIKKTVYKRLISKNIEKAKSDKEILNSIVYHEPSKNKNCDMELKEIRSDSLTRTRNELIDYASENEKHFKSFVTLTFKENISDIDEANKIFHRWRTSISRAMKNLGSEFKYLCVPEFQKRGAVHYHMLTNLECGSELLPYQKNGSEKQFDVKYWTYGFSSAFDIENDTDSNFNIALYITKYLYKDIDNRLFGRRKIMKSTNLKKPNVEYMIKDSDTYKNAMNYINQNYNLVNAKEVITAIDNPYAIDFDIFDYMLKID